MTNTTTQAVTDARHLIINVLVSSKSWTHGYAEAFVDDFASRAPAVAVVAEPVAVIGDTFSMFWVGAKPIAELARKHNLKVGDKLYTAPPSTTPSEQQPEENLVHLANAAPGSVQAPESVTDAEIIAKVQADWNASQPNFNRWENLSEHDHLLLVAAAARTAPPNYPSDPDRWGDAAMSPHIEQRMAPWLTNGAALHPLTINLVVRFARALAAKLAAAEVKYGYSDGWADPSWMDECRANLMEHIAKGDPRDVAAYCMFLWHHSASTAAQGKDAAPSGGGALQVPGGLIEALRGGRQCDEDGSEIIMSRQACHEAADILERLIAPAHSGSGASGSVPAGEVYDKIAPLVDLADIYANAVAANTDDDAPNLHALEQAEEAARSNLVEALEEALATPAELGDAKDTSPDSFHLGSGASCGVQGLATVEAGPWKAGLEYLPYHPSASHVQPDYRDGWNACYTAAILASAKPVGEVGG